MQNDYIIIITFFIKLTVNKISKITSKLAQSISLKIKVGNWFSFRLVRRLMASLTATVEFNLKYLYTILSINLR